MANINNDNRDVWGNPRVPYVYANQGKKGYFCRLPTSVKTDNRHKWFSTITAGGEDMAYKDAVRWRDAHLPPSHKKRVASHKKRLATKQVNNGPSVTRPTSFGKTGIELLERQGKDGTRCGSIRAFVRDRGAATAHTRSFAIKKYGFSDAIRQAVTIRIRWEQQYFCHVGKLTVAQWCQYIEECYRQHDLRKITAGR